MDARIKEWEREVDIGLKAGSTVTAYVSDAENHVRPRLGTIKLNDPNWALRCQDLINDLASKYVREHEVAAKVIRQTFKFAVKRKWLKRSLSPTTS